MRRTRQAAMGLLAMMLLMGAALCWPAAVQAGEDEEAALFIHYPGGDQRGRFLKDITAIMFEGKSMQIAHRYGLDLYTLGEFEYIDLDGAASSVPPPPPSSGNCTAILYPNYPNPFDGTTCIRYELSTPSRVELGIFSVDGRSIRKLADHRNAAGVHTVFWDGTGPSGTRVPAGVYFYRLHTPQGNAIRRLAVLQ